MAALEGVKMKTQEQRQFRLVISVFLSIIFAAYLSSTAHAADGDISRVNGAISIAAGDQVGSLRTVNGSVRLANDVVAGELRTVNGSIQLAEHSSARQASTVNGSIRLAGKARIATDVQTVNGSISLAPGATVGGAIKSVNGHILLDSATAYGDIETVNADVMLRNGSQLHGDLIVRQAQGSSSWQRLFWPFRRKQSQLPKIEIGADCELLGTLHLYRPVRLSIADTANVAAIIHHYQ